MVSSSIFQKFSGEGSPSPLPRPLPHFFSGFALNFQALCAFDSGFALDSRALRALDSGFALNFRLENLVWPPPKTNSPLRLSVLRSVVWCERSAGGVSFCFACIKIRKYCRFSIVRQTPLSTLRFDDLAIGDVLISFYNVPVFKMKITQRIFG